MYASTPLYNMFILDNKRNVAARNEKAFIKSSMFTIPCYVIIVVYVIVQVYFLCLYSTNWKPDLPIFHHKHETYLDLLILSFTLGFFCIVGLAGAHEIGHWPETHNKLLGLIPFVSIFNTHFQNEHILNHHKNLGTPLDPASHKKGSNLYVDIPKAMMENIVTTW